MGTRPANLHEYEVHYRTAQIDARIGREGVFARDVAASEAYAARTLAAAAEDGYTLDTVRLDAEAQAHVDEVKARKASAPSLEQILATARKGR